MSYTIDLRPVAARQLKKLTLAVQEQIIKKLEIAFLIAHSNYH